MRARVTIALLASACGGGAGPRAAASPVLANAPSGAAARCTATEYVKRPVEADSMLVADGALYWLDSNGGDISSIPIGGGMVSQVSSGELNASAYSLIRVGRDLVYVNSDRGTVNRVPLAGGEPEAIIDDIRHARAVVHAAGMYVVGGEDGLYARAPNADETVEITDELLVDLLAVHDDVAYALLDDALLEIKDPAQPRTLVRGLRKLTGMHEDTEEATAFTVTARGALWATNQRALWLYEFATGKTRKLGETADIATSMLAAGDDVYIAGGKRIERLRGDTLTPVPIDTSRWDGRDAIWAIAVSETSLFYLSPWNTLAETCR